jgi:gamma-glutamylcyclotransferase
MSSPSGQLLNYLGYGSNLFVQRIVERIPSAKSIATAIVPGYRLRFDKCGRDGSSKANMFFSGSLDHAIHAAIYSIAASEKSILDEIEGDAYKTHEMIVTTDTGDDMRVFTYIAEQSATGSTLRPYSWYRALVLEGARWHGFPKLYCDSIAAVEVIEDEDLGRDALNRYDVL